VTLFHMHSGLPKFQTVCCSALTESTAGCWGMPHGSLGELQGRSSHVYLHVVVYVIGFSVRAAIACVGRQNVSCLRLAQIPQESTLSRGQSPGNNTLHDSVLHVSVLPTCGCTAQVSCASRVNRSDATHVSQPCPHLMTCPETTCQRDSSDDCFPNVDMHCAQQKHEVVEERTMYAACPLSAAASAI
jgi:hypothetical protein